VDNKTCDFIVIPRSLLRGCLSEKDGWGKFDANAYVTLYSLLFCIGIEILFYILDKRMQKIIDSFIQKRKMIKQEIGPQS